ncbi:M56 family metallopeptidase [Clostridium sp. E02]|uniref:M56 family metallopeptidase n=1 Tax=Clostridium sp. E02 TaxID=2487134 RepID=UPI000F5491A2|nr:M56 family metallopeptidase [Clostridium sp. E02]
MVASISSLITITLISNLSIVAVWIFLRNHKRIHQISISLLLLGVFLIYIRLMVPFEFTFQQTIFVKHLLPSLLPFFYHPIHHFHRFTVYVYHVILIIWMVGIVCFGFRTTLAYIKFKRLLDEEACVNDGVITYIIKDIEDGYGISSKIRVVQTDIISVPLVFGLFKPKIILPQMELTQKELHSIILHEVTHYYHHDLWIKLLVEIISVIYWWNPLLYILKQQIDKVLEIRVDLKATKFMTESDQLEYLECLLKIAKNSAPPQVSDFSLAFDSRNVSVLSQRFHIVLNHDLKRKFGIKGCFFAMVIMSVFLFSSFVVIEPYAVDPEVQHETIELKDQKSYLLVDHHGGYDLYINHRYFGKVKGM